jgi:Rps23 Pro-64 3,4-dihydroxylase Tpa1-like proline 4-hydroxylase
LLNPQLDVSELTARYAIDDRVRVDELLTPETTSAVHEAAKSLPYDYLFFSGGQTRLATESQMAALTPEQRKQLQQELNEMARKGVGYLYSGYRMEGERLEAAPAVLRSLFELMNSDSVLSLIRQISGIAEIYSADGHFTRFTPGHYLTRHSDNVTAEQRRIAYVLSLTPEWHPDWGGLLQFFEEDGRPRDAWEPRMGSLSLFDVRHVHSVTYVAPWAESPRLSLTGWFSSRRV